MAQNQVTSYYAKLRIPRSYRLAPQLTVKSLL